MTSVRPQEPIKWVYTKKYTRSARYHSMTSSSSDEEIIYDVICCCKSHGLSNKRAVTIANVC